MTFRAVVRDGMININTHGELPDGTEVEVVRVVRAGKRGRGKASGAKRSASTRRPAKKDPFLDAFGIWKDRPEWKGKTTLEIQQELRRKAMGGRARG